MTSFLHLRSFEEFKKKDDFKLFVLAPVKYIYIRGFLNITTGTNIRFTLVVGFHPRHSKILKEN